MNIIIIFRKYNNNMTHDSCGTHQIFPKKETTKVYNGSAYNSSAPEIMVHVCPKMDNFQGQKYISPLLIICFKVHNLATTKGESVCDYIQQEARNDCLERR